MGASSAGAADHGVALSHQLGDRPVLAEVLPHSDYQLLTDRQSQLLLGGQQRTFSKPL